MFSNKSSTFTVLASLILITLVSAAPTLVAPHSRETQDVCYPNFRPVEYGTPELAWSGANGFYQIDGSSSIFSWYLMKYNENEYTFTTTGGYLSQQNEETVAITLPRGSAPAPDQVWTMSCQTCDGDPFHGPHRNVAGKCTIKPLVSNGNDLCLEAGAEAQLPLLRPCDGGANQFFNFAV
ncbi:hypothetical protein VNI00_006449 [Paramarasmius palmivorus]|uniref:Uncharacterized protein n=1 Tax=Paramarasmius palmivorus TaxID=297713 RepID=A0AAW0D9T2_9AGAR